MNEPLSKKFRKENQPNVIVTITDLEKKIVAAMDRSIDDKSKFFSYINDPELLKTMPKVEENKITRAIASSLKEMRTVVSLKPISPKIINIKKFVGRYKLYVQPLVDRKKQHREKVSVKSHLDVTIIDNFPEKRITLIKEMMAKAGVALTLINATQKDINSKKTLKGKGLAKQTSYGKIEKVTLTSEEKEGEMDFPQIDLKKLSKVPRSKERQELSLKFLVLQRHLTGSYKDSIISATEQEILTNFTSLNEEEQKIEFEQVKKEYYSFK